MISKPELSFRKRLLTRVDGLLGEMNRCLMVAAIGLACVDMVGYAAIFSQTYATDVYAAPWRGAVDAVGTAPIVGAQSFVE